MLELPREIRVPSLSSDALYGAYVKSLMDTTTRKLLTRLTTCRIFTYFPIWILIGALTGVCSWAGSTCMFSSQT